GFPEDATFAQVTQSATIASDGQNVQLNFAGEYIRSSSVVGNVVAADAMMSGGDGQPETLVGVTVTLGGEHAMGETMETAEDGGFMFTGLRAGTYTVTISDFPEDVSFETVSLEIEVGVGEVGNADFTGHFIRTSAVEGQVIIDGEGLAGVTVSLMGGPADESYTMLTDADGMFRFEELRPGDYTVSITNPDTRDYDFAATSQDVSVDLDETGTVDFTGFLLRTSGISGRVSVEGMGLGDIEVTLAGGDESRMAMTDAGGQYSFAGLAAGDYTVSIAVASDAYVFGSMSEDVALGDDESAIVNFEGMHARTASVSGQLFIDELDKNDMHDQGEEPFPSPSMLAALQGLGLPLPQTLAVPITLVGPAVHEVRSGSLNVMTGQYSFGELRAGAYQLQIGSLASLLPALPAPLAAVLQDFEYGGPAEGYAVSVAAGEAAVQNVPVDITHTTINVAVTLKGGDYRGEPIPGASVDLYSDEDGETKIGGGMTGDNGATSIRIARMGTSDNTVHMAVSSDYFMAPDADMQAVTWNPQSTVHPVPVPGASPMDLVVLNDADILNLSVDVSVGGATVMTDYGGGKPLAGWVLAVVTGDPTDPTSLMAVEGAPAMLDADGMAAFEEMLAPTDLPKPYIFDVVPDSLQPDLLDGGEEFGSQPASYVHTGLMLDRTMDAGMIGVQYTTQTLKVYAHHEMDQVMGYTGNILGGDTRAPADMVDLEIRYIDDDGRSRSFTNAEWDDDDNTSFKDGVTTFAHLPAAANVIVSADEAVDGIMLLDPDELAAYTGMEANGITGGAFGANGGFSHTVELCPLQATNPQDHGECASFAYVTTHTVSGLVWKRGVTMDPAGDGFKTGGADDTPTFVPGITVTVSPVEGKNLAGDEESATTTEDPVRTAGETSAGTEVLDETHQFNFADMAAGVYTVDVPDGWRYRMGGKGSEEMVGDALSPLATDVALDVTPSTATVYGRLTGSDGFALDSVTVTANNASTMTDEMGRYIIEGIESETRRIRGVTQANKVFVQAAAEGFTNSALQIIDFAANMPVEHDIDLSGVQARASISGTVRASGSNAPVAGALIKVDGAAPLNAPTRGVNAGKLLTGADGTYTAIIAAKGLGATASVSASKAGMTFVPAALVAPAHAGAEITGIDFTGFVNATISGRVTAPGGGPQMGAAITATSTTDSTLVVHDTTGVTGTFSLNV
ncbi:MAG: carboxypeptidase regulatory-like domain-containing protein, partial [Gammaproteobacteria bacterium]|nr:carboxypeptidase regulatory-like domain-containing protein [Gammaproteobacteria bacterium]